MKVNPFNLLSKTDESLEKLADEDKKEQEETDKKLEPFVERVKKLLGERVKEVKLTHRLTDTPAIVTTDANDMNSDGKTFYCGGSISPGSKI